MAESDSTKEEIIKLSIAVKTLRQTFSTELKMVQDKLKTVQDELKMVQDQLQSSSDDAPSHASSYHELLCGGTLFDYSKTLPLHHLVECANYKIQKYCEFSWKGQCVVMAAEYAYKWISTCYPLMNPRIIRDAILIRPYGEEPLAFHDRTRTGAATQTRAVEPGMKVAIWKGKHKPLSSNWKKKHDPIWECLAFTPTTTRTGCLHTVLLVTTEEGHRVCLDLSIGHFLEEELFGVMLYYSDVEVS